MSTWYRVANNRWGRCEIAPVEVEKTTNKTLVICGRRFSKTSGWEAYFETYAAARDYIIDKKTNLLRHAQRDHDSAKDTVAAAHAIPVKEPKT